MIIGQTQSKIFLQVIIGRKVYIVLIEGKNHFRVILL